MVSIDCPHVMPCCMSPDASVYVVMTTDMPIQSAAMLYVDQVRLLSGVGARSSFQSGLPLRSSVTSTKSCSATVALKPSLRLRVRERVRLHPTASASLPAAQLICEAATYRAPAILRYRDNRRR